MIFETQLIFIEMVWIITSEFNFSINNTLQGYLQLFDIKKPSSVYLPSRSCLTNVLNFKLLKSANVLRPNFLSFHTQSVNPNIIYQIRRLNLIWNIKPQVRIIWFMKSCQVDYWTHWVQFGYLWQFWNFLQ